MSTLILQQLMLLSYYLFSLCPTLLFWKIPITHLQINYANMEVVYQLKSTIYGTDTAFCMIGRRISPPLKFWEMHILQQGCFNVSRGSGFVFVIFYLITQNIYRIILIKRKTTESNVGRLCQFSCQQSSISSARCAGHAEGIVGLIPRKIAIVMAESVMPW